jgi:hypothetical protein
MTTNPQKEGQFKINIPQYECPKHGINNEGFFSSIPGFEGAWCTKCALEKLDELGVSRMKKVEGEVNDN